VVVALPLWHHNSAEMLTLTHSAALQFRKVVVGRRQCLQISLCMGRPPTNLDTSLDPILEERSEKHVRIDLIDVAYSV
jgi:hypothetical protein